jgi:hypothetical protein
VKNRFRAFFLLGIGAFLYGVVPVRASVAPDNSPEHARAELRAYFKDIGKNAPTAFGELSQSPGALKAIDERLASLSDADLSRLQKMMADAPDWKAAPELIAKSFPPEMLQQIKKVGADYTARVPKAETMRQDVEMLVRVLKMAPDAKLKEMGIDRKMLASLEGTFAGMSPLQVAMLQRQAVEGTTWRQNSALALQNIPLAFQHGAAALAKHGPLTDQDVKELTAFRDRMLHLLYRLEMLPEDARRKLKAEDLAHEARQIHDASPDALFMLRENISAEQLKTLEGNVALVERLTKFTDDEKKDLEKFRGEFGQALKPLDTAAGKSINDVLSTLGPTELYVVKKRLDAMGEWQVALPATYQAIAEPETAAKMKALQMPAPDPHVVLELQMFRQQALAYIDANASAPGVEAQLADRARNAVTHARLDRLELLRLTVEKMPQGASPEAMFTIAAMSADFEFGGCSFEVIPRLCFPEVCVDPCLGIDGGCEFCTPAFCTPAVNADLNFICNPIEDALQGIKNTAISSANTLISGMQTAINTAIGGLNSTINGLISSVNSVIDDAVHAITGVVDDIYAFVQTIPDKAWSVMKLALDALLDINIKNGVTLRQLIAEGVEQSLKSMTTLVGLSGDWWNAVANFTIPEIPCPPANFHTPFGIVGTAAAAHNFNRYNVLIGAIMDMLPDTELSLSYKIPAQFLFASFEFLGVCLDQASATSADNLAQERHDLVITNFGNINTYLTAQFNILALNSSNQTTALNASLEKLDTDLTTTINFQSSTTNTAITTETTNITNLVNTRSDALEALAKKLRGDTSTNLSSFKTSWLRLWIEMVLASDGDSSLLGAFELQERPGMAGYLAVVQDVVKTTLANMTIANEKVGGAAQSKYDKGVAAMAAGQDKDAYKWFVQAYQEATK